MSDFGLKGVPTGAEYAVANMIAKALEVISEGEMHRPSIWELTNHLRENCPEAQGEGSDTFFQVTVAKALDQMEQTEVIERKRNGLRLTSVGRRSLLGKGEARSDKEDADDSEARAEQPKAAPSLRAHGRKLDRADCAPPRAEGESGVPDREATKPSPEKGGSSFVASARPESEDDPPRPARAVNRVVGQPRRPAGWGRSDPARGSDSPGWGVRERQPSPIGRNRSRGAGRAEDQPVFGAAWGRGGGDARGGQGAGRPGRQAPKGGTESDFLPADGTSE
jgi:hypothetical protein